MNITQTNCTGIIICLKDSKNFSTIKKRTKKLIKHLIIQSEVRHPISSTIGCFNAHVNAITYAIEIMKYQKLNYVIIGEEDIYIDYNSYYYKNIECSINNYNIHSDYILHLGGLPTFTNNIYDIFINLFDNYTLKTNVYLTTCYVINLKTANKLLEALKNSSNHIHCDAIFANSNLNQRLVRGNIVNQLGRSKGDNTPIHNYITTKELAIITLALNKFSILFLDNIYIYVCYLSYVCYVFYACYYYFHFGYHYFSNFKKFILLLSIISETLIIITSYCKKKYIDHRYNNKVNKNIYLYLELAKIFRIFTLFKVLQ